MRTVSVCALLVCVHCWCERTVSVCALLVKEHKRAFTSSDVVYYTSAVDEHAIKNNHHIDWNNAKVVDYQQNIHQRCYLESWYIRRNESPMNRETGTLPEVYNSLAIGK